MGKKKRWEGYSYSPKADGDWMINKQTGYTGNVCISHYQGMKCQCDKCVANRSCDRPRW